MKTTPWLLAIFALQAIIVGLLVARHGNHRRDGQAAPAVRVSDDWCLELRSNRFEGRPFPYASVYVLGFNQVAAFCGGKFYECRELPRPLRERIVYWMNADHRALRLDRPRCFDGASGGEPYEAAVLLPAGEIMFREAVELTFVDGKGRGDAEFQRLMAELMGFLVCEANQVSSVPRWLDDFYEAAGEETLSEVLAAWKRHQGQ